MRADLNTRDGREEDERLVWFPSCIPQIPFFLSFLAGADIAFFSLRLSSWVWF
jgi:hypothetical protein